MDKRDLEDCLDKRLAFTKTFPNTGETFSGLNNATEWLRERGYDIGSMESRFPIGLARDCDYIAKWTKIDFWERKKLDGAIVPGNLGFRNGDAVVHLKEDPGERVGVSGASREIAPEQQI